MILLELPEEVTSCMKESPYQAGFFREFARPDPPTGKAQCATTPHLLVCTPLSTRSRPDERAGVASRQVRNSKSVLARGSSSSSQSLVMLCGWQGSEPQAIRLIAC